MDVHLPSSPSITRYDVDAFDPVALCEFPGEGMFTSTVPYEQDAQFLAFHASHICDCDFVFCIGKLWKRIFFLPRAQHSHSDARACGLTRAARHMHEVCLLR